MPSAPTNSALRRAFILCVLCLAVFQFSENTTDVDLWGHVVFGQDFLSTGKLATTEPYSWTAAGNHWINHEIIAEVALAVAHRALGGAGLLLLKILVGLVTLLIAIRIANFGRADLLVSQDARQRVPTKSIITWAFAALAVVEIYFGFAARPQIFTALALVIEFWLLRQIHAGRWRWAFALPLLFAVWINTHGGALAGIVLLLVTAITTTAQAFGGKFAPGFIRARIECELKPGVIGALWIFFAASAAALLCNPYGLELIRWLVESVLWLRPEIAEWNPVQLNGDHAAFFCCVAIASASFLLSRRPIALWELACAGALGFMAFRSARHTPLFCLAALAFVPPHLADVLVRFQTSFARLAELGRRRAVQTALTALLVLGSLGIIIATFTLHKEYPLTMEVPRKQYPVAALDFIKQHELRGNLVVFFDWGEQCIWELPDSKVSIDGRLDTCYPRSVINAHWKFYNNEPYDRAALNLEQADFALLPADMAGAVALWKQGGWSAVYYDDRAVVLVKDAKKFPKLASVSTTVQGSPESTKGRAAFPDRPSARFTVVR